MQTITAKASRAAPEVRAKLKEQQLARLALKAKVAAGDIDSATYSAAYAAQPEQVKKAADHAAQAAERAKAREARHASAIADADGAADAFKGASQ